MATHCTCESGLAVSIYCGKVDRQAMLISMSGSRMVSVGWSFAAGFFYVKVVIVSVL